MTKSHILVLGGGEDQLPAYHEARRLGHGVIGVDQRPEALGAAAADLFLCMTTRDPQRIAAMVGHLDVAAVVSPASDAAQESVAELSRLLKTPHQPSPDAVRASVDKGYFHSVLARLGLPAYRHVQSDDPAELRRAAAELPMPVIVKPSDSSGSKGVQVVADPEALPAALDEARRYSFSGQVIVEEMLLGRHLSAEAFLQGARLGTVAVTERTTTGAPRMITTGHTVPAELAPATEIRLRSLIMDVCGELGHVDGPVNFDFVVDEHTEEIRFIEMGARLGGNGMPLLVKHAYGINTYEAALRLALGEDFDLTPRHNKKTALRILTSDTDGVLRAVEGADAVRALPQTAELQIFASPGGKVHRYTQAGHKLGYLLLVADSHAELREARARADALLRFDVEPDPDRAPAIPPATATDAAPGPGSDTRLLTEKTP
ncbi:ATP-grasp domain-containing protein [Streptomyces sp. NPDC014744]|uniref:ATP-grasp domain-containing protein n=1 Tax=Streptomyces sp. NPDC014744 TaxID=3364903 RepID=UPI0036FB7137